MNGTIEGDFLKTIIRKCEKLLKVSIEKEGDIIKNIKISGDFFIYPEEALDELEEFIKNKSINDLKDKLESFIKNKNIIILGFKINDLLELIENA
jgi:hypothetical protein